MKIYEYNHNNSGGSDWLSDSDWKALKKAGWRLYGYEDFIFKKDGSYSKDCGGFPRSKKAAKRFSTALKKFASLDEAVLEWEHIVGQSLDEDGCECCGRPHHINEL